MIKVSLTFDTDWVHEDAIDYVISLLGKYNQKATFFATNEYASFFKSDFCHEVGIHPNFNDLLTNGKSNYKDVIDKFAKTYPKAKGFRSHSLTTSSHILNYFSQLGFIYDSNQYHPSGAKVFLDYSNLYRFTHNYVDLGHLIEGSSLTIKNINFSLEHLNIFDFHPVHIFLNTPSVDYYNQRKHLTNSNQLKLMKNTDEKGIGDLFIELLQFLKTNKIKTEKLISLI